MISAGLPSASSGRSADCGLAAAAEQRLRESGLSELKSVRCACRGGILTLVGDVPSSHWKYFAQRLTETLEGVRAAGCVINCIHVKER